jgi:putative DNA primase/helicase
VPRLEAVGADLANIHILKRVVLDGGANTTFSLQQDLHALAEKIKEIGNVVLVIIDPITSYMGNKIDSHRTTDVRHVLAPLEDFAQDCGVAVLTISHPPKAPQAKAINAISGSLAFGAAPRLVFLVIEDPDNQGRRLLLLVKNTLGPHADGLGFSLVQRMVFNNIVASHVAWDTMPVTVTANQALAAASPAGASERSKLREATEFLCKELDDGPQPASTVREKAAAMGISDRTLKRARKRLRVTVKKDGFKAGWLWSISDPPPPAEDDQEMEQLGL